MSRFWTPRTAKLQPYTPGEQPVSPGLIKLNTNEHCLTPSPSVLKEIHGVSADQLRRYPDPDATALCAAIAKHERLQPAQVFAGNGSDEVLAACFMAYFADHAPLTIPDITYSFYPVWAALYGTDLRTCPLNSDFAINIEAFGACEGHLLFANPNAPTGRALELADIAWLCRQSDRLVVVDEAYYGFGSETAATLIDRFDNLLITRTLSKSHALAGMRVGYALGHADLIGGLKRVKDSFNSYPLDVIAQRAAAAAINDGQWFQNAGAAVAALREELAEGLSQLAFRVMPSSANFLFVEHPKHHGAAIYQALREANILVRRWDKDRIGNWLRITVGTGEQNEALLRTLASKLEHMS